MTPAGRIRALNQAPLRPARDYVLYWMTSFRRARSNFSLQRAVEHARAMRKALVVFEPLRVGYPHASDRLHAFVLQVCCALLSLGGAGPGGGAAR